jgi:hypothetical protein
MKSLARWITKKINKVKIEDCMCFEIHKIESDELYGGYKEYKPNIYEKENTIEIKARINNLFSDEKI